jgi:hypothetical protein
MEERSGINNLVGIDYSFLASFIVSPVLNIYYCHGIHHYNIYF